MTDTDETTAGPPGQFGSHDDILEFVRRLDRQNFLRCIAADIIGAGTVAIVLALAIPAYPGGISYARAMTGFVLAGVGVVFGIAFFAFFHVRWLSRRATEWITEGREATSADVRGLASLPRVGVLVNLSYWVVGTVGTFVVMHVTVGYEFTFEAAWKATIIYALGAVIATTLVYLVVEASIRPLLNAVLPADTEFWPSTMSLRSRLLLAWLCVAGAPLITIAAVLVGLDDRQRILAVPSVIVATLLATVVGLFVFVVAGRTITAPIERVRGALRGVADGDFSWHIELDEVGEIGRLQAGFNQMVDGLRERERMRDVFGRHVGVDVAQRAMEMGFDATGETCEATAMFVDIIGSTGLAEQKDPDAVVVILNRFFDAVVRVVTTEGGFINKFQGDGALCLFGTPVSQSDHAARGLRAARSLAIELAPMGDIAAAIGVSSGRVVAGNVGSSDRYEFTVIGDPVNEAARLTDEAKLRTTHILASERTVVAAGKEGEAWMRGEAIALRGRSQPTITYSLYD